MSIRNVSLAAVLCAAVEIAALGQTSNQGTSYLFLEPGQQSAGARMVAYVSAVNNLNVAFDGSGPVGAFKVLAKPDGSKFFILGTQGTSALQSANSSFSQFSTV